MALGIFLILLRFLKMDGGLTRDMFCLSLVRSLLARSYKVVELLSTTGQAKSRIVPLWLSMLFWLILYLFTTLRGVRPH